ncbi:hypothetical protein F5Y14DRAFT_376136 [Nemania sp. NC0429]|nr:hypothetical protein F5Y14DRAFT_376136 [Nemania sp. NC0429]
MFFFILGCIFPCLLHAKEKSNSKSTHVPHSTVLITLITREPSSLDIDTDFATMAFEMLASCLFCFRPVLHLGLFHFVLAPTLPFILSPSSV